MTLRHKAFPLGGEPSEPPPEKIESAPTRSCWGRPGDPHEK
jgi:hypothetical protein